MFAGSRLLLPVYTNCVTLVPKPGRKEGHAVREPSLLSGIAVLRRSGSRKWRRPPVAARSGGAGAKEEGGGNRRTFKHFNNKINKPNRKAAAPHGRLPHTKHKVKSRPGPLSFQCRHSSFYSFRSSSVGLETGEWRRCRSLSFTPPASLRSHGSRPRPTRHNNLFRHMALILCQIWIKTYFVKYFI